MEKQLIQDYKDGMSGPKLAAKYGIRKDRVWRIIERAGAHAPRQFQPRQKQEIYERQKSIVLAARRAGKTPREAATMAGCTMKFCYTVCSKAGVVRRRYTVEERRIISAARTISARERLKSEGICTECGKEPAKKHKATCAGCGLKMAKNQRARTRRLRLVGLCGSCGVAKCAKKRKRCVQCQEKTNKAAAECMRKKAAEGNRCTICASGILLPAFKKTKSVWGRLCETCYLKRAADANCKDRSKWAALKQKLEQQNYRCAWTGRKLVLGVNDSLDHILPKVRFPKLRYSIDNLEWVCRDVNIFKRDRTPDEFVALMKEILAHRSL